MAVAILVGVFGLMVSMIALAVRVGKRGKSDAEESADATASKLVPAVIAQCPLHSSLDNKVCNLDSRLRSMELTLNGNTMRMEVLSSHMVSVESDVKDILKEVKRQ
jgi:hypothetical protein